MPVGLQCYAHMLNFTWIRWRCCAPGVWTSHSNTDLAGVCFLQVSVAVVGSKPLCGKQNTPVVSQIPVNEMYLTKHECLMCRCPPLSLSRPSMRPMKRKDTSGTLSQVQLDSSQDWWFRSDELAVLHWLWKRSWGHKLRGICLHLARWVPHLEFDFGLEKY